jgi:DegV family protein with EDD domain
MDLYERYNISVIPLSVALGDRLCRDGVDVEPKDPFSYVEETGKLPTTSAISVGEYEDFFRPFVADGYEVVHINLSSELSSSHQNARIAAQEVGNVYVLDSKSLSTGSGHLAILAAELASAGHDAAYIVNALDERKCCLDVSFVLQTLDYLHKGGRCSGVARFGANMLKLRPEIVMENGSLHVGKMYRGSMEKTILDYVRGRFTDEKEVCFDRIFVTHSGVPREILDKVVALVKELRPFEEVIETEAGSTISCHCGPECIGVLFFRK